MKKALIFTALILSSNVSFASIETIDIETLSTTCESLVDHYKDGVVSHYGDIEALEAEKKQFVTNLITNFMLREESCITSIITSKSRFENNQIVN